MVNQLNIAVCEDNITDTQHISTLLKNSGLLCRPVVFRSAEELLSAPALTGFDLFLLDIYLNGKSGIELAREIRAKKIDAEIVFTTFSDAHALEGYEVDALQYLVKPVKAPDFDRMLKRFVKIRDRQDLNYLTVVVDRNDVEIHFRDIYYIEVFDKYCLIYTKEKVIETYTSLSGLMKKLPNPPFLRCHRGYAVNMEYVRDMQDDFTMENGSIVYISQSDREKIKKDYMKYLVNNTRSQGEKIF